MQFRQYFKDIKKACENRKATDRYQASNIILSSLSYLKFIINRFNRFGFYLMEINIKLEISTVFYFQVSRRFVLQASEEGFKTKRRHI